MKTRKLLFGMSAMVLTIAIFTACGKYGELAGQNGKIVATTYKPEINQPDTMVLSGAKSTDTVTWSVTPAGMDSIITQKGAALIFFKKPGVYQVRAVDKNMQPASVSISVSDSVYTQPVRYLYTPLTGDQITLAPHYTASGDSTYLSFVAQTHNSYCASAHLQLTDSLKNGTYGINFIRVLQIIPCPESDAQLFSVINFTAGQPAPLPNGTFPLSVTLNGTTYTGSIVISTSAINFNWNYTSGVLISPTQLNR